MAANEAVNPINAIRRNFLPHPTSARIPPSLIILFAPPWKHHPVTDEDRASLGFPRNRVNTGPLNVTEWFFRDPRVS